MIIKEKEVKIIKIARAEDFQLSSVVQERPMATAVREMFDWAKESVQKLFRIEGPAVISFSGGRTSGFMLWMILQAHGGKLPDDVYVMFANTGLEDEATLRFVRDVELYWGVKIIWVEYRARAFRPFADINDWPKQHAIVNFDTASRKGEPYKILVKERQMLPNVRARFCRTELKYRTMHRVISEFLGLDDWTAVIGIRADEEKRVSSVHVQDDRREEKIAPLAVAGVINRHVLAFWSKQSFDLGLPAINGVTLSGNCKRCFLKKLSTQVTLARHDPDDTDDWIEMEEWGAEWKRQGIVSGDGDKFRIDRPSYAAIKQFALEHDEMFPIDDDDIKDCGCGE